MKLRDLFLILPIFLLGCSENEPDPNRQDAQFTISGTVTGSGSDGVSVLIGGLETATDGNGAFALSGLNAGNYLATPIKAGHYFVPETREVTLVNEDISGVDFEIFQDDEIQYAGNTWRLFNEQVYSIKRNEGNSIQLDLAENALWFQNQQGGLVYQLIAGDFTIEGRVSTVRRTNDSEEVTCAICLGGLMARDPDNSSGENYVHLVTGNTPEGIGVEHKSTVDGQSDFDATNDGSAVFDLQIVRNGNDFTLSKRAPGTSEWVEVITYTRTDLPDTLQVGFNIYTAASGDLADLSVIYEGVAISQ